MADTTLAATGLVLRRRSSGAPLALDSALEIGAGGEARVLGVPGDDALVAKLYREPTLARARKLARMIEAPPTLAGASLAWPVELLTDPGGRFAGFLMPRAEGPRLFELYNPVSRRRAAPLFDWARLHRAGASLATVFDALHAAGYVIGDVNESNILVSPEDASVTLVDADSFQVRDPDHGEVYRSGVGKAEFTPPELQGARFAEVDRAPEHDRFGLAVLLFLLLMEGTHPFAIRSAGDAEALPVEERIRRGLYPHAQAFDDCKPPRMAPPIQTLHPALQRLFLRAFSAGHTDPSARPTAAEWREALTLAEAELRACDDNPRHLFSSHIPFCPWCHRQRLLRGRDPFPASVEIAQATDGAPLPARRLPAGWAKPAAQAPGPAQQPAAVPAPTLGLARPSVPGLLGAYLRSAWLALPAWVKGPTALGSPIPWAGPIALTIMLGTTGGIRGLGMVIGFVVLRALFRRGPGRFSALTGIWLVALMLLWSVLTGVIAGARADSGPRAEPGEWTIRSTTDPAVGVPDQPASPDAPVRELSAVDRAPELINRAEVAAAVSEHYPPLLRDAGVTGTATLRFVVTHEGRVDPGSVEVTAADHDAFAQAAVEVVDVMRFSPAMVKGEPVAVSFTIPLTFQLQQ